MLQKVLIVSEGDTGLLPGSHVSKNEIVRIFADCNRKGLRKPIIKPIATCKISIHIIITSNLILLKINNLYKHFYNIT